MTSQAEKKTHPEPQTVNTDLDLERAGKQTSEITDNDNHRDLQPPTHEPLGSRPKTITGEALFLIVVCSSQLLTQAGLAIGLVPQHIIAKSFGIESQPALLSWFSAAYSLTVGTFILLSGRLGDIFGHKRLFVIGFVWFGIWSALAGFSVYISPIFFIVCRSLQGIGPALLLPNAIAILARSYEPGLRQNLIFSFFGATAPSGFVLGAVFSSLLSQLAWWPWAYWTLALVCFGLALLGLLIIKPIPQATDLDSEGSTIWQRIDLWGCITGVAGLVLFNVSWNQAPTVGWQTPYTYIIMIIGIGTFIVFLLIEKRVRHPLVPFEHLQVDSVFTLACIAAGWASFGVFTFYSLNFLEILRGHTPLLTSAQFSSISVSGLCAAIVTGLALNYLGASPVMLIAMIAFCVGGTIFATMSVHQTYWAQTFVGTVILPWGMDMSFPAATIILSRALPQRHQGLAASLVNTFVNYSISIGLGISGTVETQVNKGGTDVLRGYRGALYTGVGLSGLGVVIALTFCLVDYCRAKNVGAKASSAGEA